MSETNEMSQVGPDIALIAAVAENDVIGAGNRLPWRLPADLHHFKSLTLGKAILMGRRTFESIGRALPGRRNLVLTRRSGFTAPGIETVASLEAALAAAADARELVVIGGAELYRLCLPRARRFYLTRVHAPVAGDTRFPRWDSAEWREVARSVHPADAENPYAMTFLALERRRDPGR